MRAFEIGSLGEVVFEHNGTAQADVAVVVPLYNYGNYIEECLRSVVKQTLDRLSIVIVDDCSSDSGADVAAEFLRQHGARFCSARIVRHKRNQGASMARNSGVAWSAEPLLFMLDADNRIRPPALARLKAALEIDDADFAYSQLFIFGSEIGVGRADIWDIDRLRPGNAIDAMAMIRRSALMKVGGYGVLPDDQGWEDYDLWCQFFTLGMRGVFVPEVLCEYRRHGQSRSEVEASKSYDVLVAQMALRYPAIFNSKARKPRAKEESKGGCDRAPHRPPRKIDGWVDCIDRRHIQGWAVDRSSPQTPVEVDIFVGEKRLGSVPAELHRPDVATAGLPHSDCGFAFCFPRPLDEIEVARVIVRPARTTSNLPGTLADTRRNWRSEYFPQYSDFSYALVIQFEPDELQQTMRLRGDVSLPPGSVRPRLSLNGQYFDIQTGLPTFRRAKQFWFVDHPDRLGFAADVPIVFGANNDIWLHWSADREERMIPAVRIPANKDAWPPLPPSPNLIRVIGSDYAPWSSFVVAGATNVFVLEYLLEKIGRRVPTSGAILDWGCGCGRTTWALAETYPSAKIIGVDIDSDNLSWMQKVAPRAHAIHGDLYPPLPIETASVDLIYGHSVFTHLSETAQNQWLVELDRILSANGVAVFTLQGETTFLSTFPDLAAIEMFRSAGILDGDRDPTLNSIIGDDSYYRSTYHTTDYVRRHWGQFFEIAAMEPGRIGLHQDAVICLKRSGRTLEAS